MRIFVARIGRDEAGETLLSFLVGTFIAVIVLASALQSYFDASHRAFDHQLISETRDRAKSILDLMTYDFRMAGSGMPLNQGNFQIEGAGLGTAPLPVLTTNTATNFTVRRNVMGVSTVLTAAYTPAANNLSFSVLSGSDFEAGDIVYISDASVGGANGLRGTVTSATATFVSINAAYTASAAATFPVGSLAERVTNIAYSSPNDETGITRDVGDGAVVLSPKTTFSLRYFNSSGVELALPLTEAMIRDSLAALEVNVTVTSRKALTSGNFYVADVKQRVGLRNLYLSR